MWDFLRRFFDSGVELPTRLSVTDLALDLMRVRTILSANQRREAERVVAERETSKNSVSCPQPHETSEEVRYSRRGGVGEHPSSGVRYSISVSHRPTRQPPNLRAPVLSFSALLVSYVQRRWHGRAPLVYRRAGIDRKLYSKIVSDNASSVSKQTALQLVIGLQLSRTEADEFLCAAGYALSPTIPLDCAFAYCIEHRIWNILDVNRIVTGAGGSDLGVRF